MFTLEEFKDKLNSKGALLYLDINDPIDSKIFYQTFKFLDGFMIDQNCIHIRYQEEVSGFTWRPFFKGQKQPKPFFYLNIKDLLGYEEIKTILGISIEDWMYGKYNY